MLQVTPSVLLPAVSVLPTVIFLLSGLMSTLSNFIIILQVMLFYLGVIAITIIFFTILQFCH